MANESQPGTAQNRWKPVQVYAMAGVCLLLGLLLGYLFRDSGSRATATQSATAQPVSLAPASASGRAHPTATLDQMQQMADRQAAPLRAKLRRDPRNAALLNQLGTLYRAAHQFKQAADYYQKALQIAPNNVAARTDMASCLYYEGDVDGALNQLQQSLQYDPKDANSLFNLGMIRWRGKNDANGAVAAWEQLLQSNPTLAEARQAEVKRLISQAKQPAGGN